MTCLVLPVQATSEIYPLSLHDALPICASTVLGYIGAGGIGLYLQETLQVFDYPKTGTIIIAIILVVVLIDYVSSKSREALMK